MNQPQVKQTQNKPTQNTKPGILFQFFNIGFTVLMFITPTILLGYWYLYLRSPADGQANRVAATVPEEPNESGSHSDPVLRPNEAPSETTSTEMQGRLVESPSGEIDDPNSPSSSTSAEYPIRTWSDPTGKFTVEARLQSVTGDRATLIAEKDRKIVVMIDKLSDDDLVYLRGVFRSKGLQPSF
ncbi:SHD1 domain-containing protein [Stieleria varia]|uniref:SLA1 homology domain-containing protein n=1 Tax=Stieleria varia TaxID=2528005 RepID=A0A5C6B168_9BACT|nr:SHD1 domain-containing protein [Stieleria varia]TWU06055.1 hypothetical protein Pla52n_17740 [Stieleria varia]